MNVLVNYIPPKYAIVMCSIIFNEIEQKDDYLHVFFWSDIGIDERIYYILIILILILQFSFLLLDIELIN